MPMQRKPRRLYWVWADMIQRCRNPRHKAYANYGGRGIAVCDDWASFARFEADMGERPEGGMLDRRNNDLGYSKDNCRWSTRAEQNSNRRSCIYVLDGDEKITLKEACRRRGIKYRPVLKRVRGLGWPIDEALTTPIGEGLTAWYARGRAAA